jgi:hypothetical protein
MWLFGMSKPCGFGQVGAKGNSFGTVTGWLGSGGGKEKSQPKESTGRNRVYTNWRSRAEMKIPKKGS